MTSSVNSADSILSPDTDSYNLEDTSPSTQRTDSGIGIDNYYVYADESDVDAIYSVANKDRGSNQQDTAAAFGEITLEKPSVDSNSKLGESVFAQIAAMLFQYISDVTDRRTSRAEQMEAISHVLTDLAQEQSEKFIKKVEDAMKKQKSGIIGKILAVLGLIAAAIVTALTIAAIPATGGASIALTSAAIPAYMAVIGLCVAAFAMVDTLFNDSKITSKVLEATLGKLVQAIASALKKLGMSDSAANGLAMGIVMSLMLIVMLAVMRGSYSWSLKAFNYGEELKHANQVSKATEQVGTSMTKTPGVSASDDIANAATTTGRVDDVADAATTSGRTNNVEKVTATTEDTATKTKTPEIDEILVTPEKNQVTGKVSVKMENAQSDMAGAHEMHDKHVRMRKMNNYEYQARIAEYGIDLGTAAHGTTLAIINAELDRLIAEDQADADRLKAAIKILQNILDMHDQLSQEDVQLYDAVEGLLARFIIDQFPVMVKPVTKVHPA